MPAALLQGKLLSTSSGAMLPSLARLSISTGNNPGVLRVPQACRTLCNAEWNKD